jgi:hypothetical protein
VSADVDQVQAQAAATLDQFTSTAKATRLPDPALWFARVAGDLNATTIPTGGRWMVNHRDERRRMMTPAAKAWLWLAGGVIAYELAAQPGQLLSEQVDRWLVTHPILTRAVIVLVAGHLGNVWPQRCDPLHWVFLVIKPTRTSHVR